MSSKIKHAIGSSPVLSVADRLKAAYEAGYKVGYKKGYDTAYDKAVIHGYDVGRDIALVSMLDWMLITSHEFLKLGPNRNWQFFEHFVETKDYFDDLAAKDLKENDDPSKAYMKHMLDEKLKAAIPADKYMPYSERYAYDLDGEFIPKKIKEYFNEQTD